MACCVSQTLTWCKDLPVVSYKDEKGKEYCVFHAPKGHKEKTLEEFNALVFERIDNAKSKKELCELAHTVFEGNICFKIYNNMNPLPLISFYMAQFSGDADFHESQFGGDADFHGCKFSGQADFTASQFAGDATFHFSSFSADTLFSQSQFSGDTFFHESQFSGKADFTASQFSGEADFNASKFRGDASFLGAKFSEYADFITSQFNGKANFMASQFSEDAGFNASQFSGDADFNASHFSGRANFNASQFDGDAYFTTSQFSGKAYFQESRFFGKASFINISIVENLKFEKANMGKATFIDTDMRSIDFINCEWPQKTINNILYKYSRRVLYDELELSKETNRNKYKDKIKKVGRLYRQMKQQYKNEHNELEVSDWHYGEKEMYRKEKLLRRYFPLSLSNLYWATSGYGERPTRAGVVLVAIIIVLSILLNFFGIKLSNDDTQVIQGFSLAIDFKALGLVCFTALQHILFVKAPDYVPLNYYGKFFVTIFSKLLIPIQAALLAFSIRNKFRR